MSSTIEDVKRKLADLSREIEDKVREAHNIGFNEGLGVVLPTQKEFHKYHMTPATYGEDGEWLVVSGQYSEEVALRKIRKHLREQWGWGKADEMPTFLTKYDIGYKRYEGEPGYYLDLHASGFWEAWVWGVDQ